MNHACEGSSVTSAGARLMVMGLRRRQTSLTSVPAHPARPPLGRL